MAQPEQIM